MKAWHALLFHGLHICAIAVFIAMTVYLWPLFEVAYLLLFGMQGWTP